MDVAYSVGKELFNKRNKFFAISEDNRALLQIHVRTNFLLVKWGWDPPSSALLNASRRKGLYPLGVSPVQLNYVKNFRAEFKRGCKPNIPRFAPFANWSIIIDYFYE
jgi:hypothetical protein